MSFKRVGALCAFFLTLTLSTAQAQALRDVDGPVNFPPGSYKGKQFVDNNGCAFVRAGIDGRVNWIPRVTRSRKLLCGLKPTFSGAEANLAQAQSANAPVQITNNEAPAAAAPAPAPAPRVAAAKPAAAPKPAPKPVVAKPAPRVAPAPQPRVIDATPTTRPAPQRVQQARVQPAPQRLQPVQRTIAPAPAPKPAPRQVQRVTRATTCANFTGISAQYAGSGPGVRCGSQTQPVTGAVQVQRQPVTVMRNGQKKQSSSASCNSRPLHQKSQAHQQANASSRATAKQARSMPLATPVLSRAMSTTNNSARRSQTKCRRASAKHGMTTASIRSALK